jgi:hypothetical protein
MKNLYRNEDGTFDAMAGSQIQPTIAEAIDTAFALEQTISFEFNGVTVTVEANSNAELVYRDWDRALAGYTDTNVGPHPKETLSEDELANDARIKAENDKRAEESRAQWDAEAKAKREAFEAKLATAPEMELSDPDGWAKFVENNSKDQYSNGVVMYSQWWARLMQQAMDKGAKLEDIAESTSSEAGVEGITGFMYGATVNALAHCWKYGDQLRRWHNSKYGKQGEKANEAGGTINPAVLVIG